MPTHIRVTGVATGVATITLARPEKKNALSIALRDEVSDAVAALGRDAAVKAIVITGAGDFFSAGFDLKEFRDLTDAEHARRLWGSSDRFHHAVLACPLPTIAAVNGPALAGGFDLAILCDLRIAATTASFAHPEIAFGDIVYGPLHELVGGAVARELALTGRSISAAEALALHLVSAVVAPEELPAEVERWTGQILLAPRELLLRTKQKIIRRAGAHPAATLDL
ncbi:MAG: enoyl-CoA hydratase/isomerase family protein [Candidatus Binatia bacterium]